MENLKCDSNFRKYLKNISNDQLLEFYQDVEWTPYPMLVIDEYIRRFKPKNKIEVLEKIRIQAILEKIKSYELNKLASKEGTKTKGQLKIQASLAKKKSSELSKLAAKKSVQVSKELKNLTQTKLSKGVTAARKMTVSSSENLDLIEKLGKLKKNKLISNKEFEIKKKEILARI